jgi:hypothetical protein
MKLEIVTREGATSAITREIYDFGNVEDGAEIVHIIEQIEGFCRALARFL